MERQVESTMFPTTHKESLFSIQSLLSPPESKRPDSFNTAFASPVSIAMSRTPSASFSSASSQAEPSTSALAMAAKASKPSALLLSPPISPDTPHNDNIDKEEGEGVKDPPLFPREDSHVSDTTESLFPEAAGRKDSWGRTTVPDEVATSAGVDRSNAPTQAEYELVAESLYNLKFTPCVYQEYAKDPVKWYNRERRFEDYYRNANKMAAQRKQQATQKKPVHTASYPRLAPAPAGIRKPRAVVATPRATVRSIPRSKQTPPTRYREPSLTFIQSSPSVPKAPKAPSNRNDVDYNSIEDYCPPLSTLSPADGGPVKNPLKVDWKGTLLSLTDDPERHLLHEYERLLASALRLSCAQYLTSKRRIFKARVEAFHKGKEFRKTDAQQACKIDVNKASRLWQAFDKAGWFHPQHFRQYLDLKY